MLFIMRLLSILPICFISNYIYAKINFTNLDQITSEPSGNIRISFTKGNTKGTKEQYTLIDNDGVGTLTILQSILLQEKQAKLLKNHFTKTKEKKPHLLTQTLAMKVEQWDQAKDLIIYALIRAYNTYNNYAQTNEPFQKPSRSLWNILLKLKSVWNEKPTYKDLNQLGEWITKYARHHVYSFEGPEKNDKFRFTENGPLKDCLKNHSFILSDVIPTNNNRVPIQASLPKVLSTDLINRIRKQSEYTYFISLIETPL